MLSNVKKAIVLMVSLKMTRLQIIMITLTLLY